MTLPPEKRFKFFVYIVESPSPLDLYHRIYESDLLTQAVRLHGIPCVARTAVSKEAFDAALRIGLPDAMKESPGLVPIVHISAHGDQDGIQLTGKEVIRWDELGEILTPVNRALKGCLVVCMSCCYGFHGIRMAMIPEGKELPFFAIVGNTGSPAWSDTAVAFASFYHLLAKGEYVVKAADAMNIASGTTDFYVDTATHLQTGYLEHLKKLTLGDFLRQLQQDTDKTLADQRSKFTKAQE